MDTCLGDVFYHFAYMCEKHVDGATKITNDPEIDYVRDMWQELHRVNRECYDRNRPEKKISDLELSIFCFRLRDVIMNTNDLFKKHKIPFTFSDMLYEVDPYNGFDGILLRTDYARYIIDMMEEIEYTDHDEYAKDKFNVGECIQFMPYSFGEDTVDKK